MIIFYLFFLAIFLLEGLGVNGGRTLTFHFILILPFFLFLPAIRQQNKLTTPRSATLLYLLFLLFSAISTLSSVNIQTSFEYLLFYAALFLVFLYAYNHRQRLQLPLLTLIFASSFLLAFFSLAIRLGKTTSLDFAYPNYQTGYNLVYSHYETHNLLGDFLLVPLVLSLVLLLTKQMTVLPLISIFFLSPFFLLAYSRSAYLSLIAILTALVIFLTKKTKKKIPLSHLNLLVILIILASLLFFTTVEEALYYPPFSHLTVWLKEHTNLTYKTFWSWRGAYLKQGLTAFHQDPLFGVGPQNLRYASEKYLQEPDQLSYSSHNIFLDILFENGLLAGSFFLGFILLILLALPRALKDPHLVPFGFALLALLVNFQTIYSFDIYSLLFLFFVLAGITSGDLLRKSPGVKSEAGSNTGSNTGVACIIAGVIALIVFAKAGSNFFHQRDQNLLAFYLYPLNKAVYSPLIAQSPAHLKLYAKLFSGDADVLEEIGDAYLRYGNESQALLYYEKAFYAKKFNSPELLKKYYRLKVNKAKQQPYFLPRQEF